MSEGAGRAVAQRVSGRAGALQSAAGEVRALSLCVSERGGGGRREDEAPHGVGLWLRGLGPNPDRAFLWLALLLLALHTALTCLQAAPC